MGHFSKSIPKNNRSSKIVDSCCFFTFQKWLIRVGFITFTFAGDENGKREEDLEEEIKDVKERFRDAEVKMKIS